MASRIKKISNERSLEILGIVIMMLALLIFLGLISHNASDFPNSGSKEHIQNWMGLGGAIISHYLYVYTIGYACLVFPFLLFLYGWNIFLQRPFRPFLRLSVYVLALGLFFSTSMAIPEVVSETGSKFGFHLSGLLGGFFAEQLHHFLGAIGSVIVLLTFLLLFLISATSWSMREALLGFKEEMQVLFESIRGKRKSIIPLQHQPKSQKPVVIEEPERPSIPIAKPQRSQPIAFQSPEKSQERTERPAPKSAMPKPAATGPYQFPSLDLLTPSIDQGITQDRGMLEKKAHFLEERLKEFDVRGNVVGIHPGPVITRFEIKPAPGVKVSRFVGCQDDLALVMQASRVRVVAPIPGKAAVGIEIPNAEPAVVSLRDILGSKAYQRSDSFLTLALGLTIEGNPYVADLAQMPHLLVAGATGSGKSVCLNSIIASILFRSHPSDVKLVLIDPKKLELSLYKKLKHHHLTTREDLSEDVITTVENAVSVMRSLELEMERRYRILARLGVRNIADYNQALKNGRIPPEEDKSAPEKLPYIVLIVDELADLMIIGAREVEEPIARLAQMSRAVGIHLILATQRPSVDVITGVIKANFPSRIAFQVAAKTDSRTILDRNGAEKLLGRGDMLFLNPREPEPVRVHGAFVSTEEVQRVVNHISQQPREEPWRLPSFGSKEVRGRGGPRSSQRDELFQEAAKLVIRHQQGSASLLQRRLRVGYARAGRLIDELEDVGILGPFDGSKAREVLVDENFIDQLHTLDDQNPLTNEEIPS